MDNRICILRLLASFMVVMLHVSGIVFVRWEPGWIAGNFFDSLTRTAVPLFLLAAGATLVPRDEAFGVFFKKRGARILGPLLVWSVFYLWWLRHNGTETGNWLLAILSGPTMYHLWFFYTLVGLYLAIPVLRKFYRNSTRSEHRWFIATWFLVASILPTANTFFFISSCEGGISFPGLQVFSLNLFTGYIGFLLLGAYAYEGHSEPRLGLALFATSTTLIFVFTHLTSSRHGEPCQFFYVYLNPLVVVASYGLFTAVLGLNRTSPSRLLTTLADCTLGVYGLHVFVIGPLSAKSGLTVDIATPWLSILFVSGAAFAFSLAVIYAIRLIPPLRNFF